MANISSPHLSSPSSFLRTPPKLAVSKLSRTPRCTMAHSQEPAEECVLARQPLGELLANFSYASTVSPSAHRAKSGQAATKRRRVELADAFTVSGIAKKPAKNSSKGSEAASKPAKAPKKAQTITAVAIKAYQPAKQPEIAPPSTVSEYDVATKDVAVAEKSAKEPEKVKKPRKPRTQARSAAEAGTAEHRTKKPGRPKKAKVTFKESEYLAPLYSPEHAMSQAQKQQFLFGTSSQLAVDESPSFIRRVQLALTESEDTLPSTQTAGTQTEHSPVKKSYIQVPMAPHGTSLSVGQGDREHWTAGSRNFEGGLHRDKSGLSERPKSTKPVVIEIAATQPQPNQRNVPSLSPPKKDEWISIDEIEDETPPTPSPPRRRASASPVPVPPLTFNTAEPKTPTRKTGKASENKSTLSRDASLKATDPQWVRIKSTLFSQITATVKDSPRTQDLVHPTWHQKILLYDPIVLEDFTAWLNDQGLRINVQRQVKAKKGRKKKTQKDTDGQMAPDEPLPVETVTEVLQPWMVQKWCEEKSICCLWKEGLRGGVRTRY